LVELIGEKDTYWQINNRIYQIIQHKMAISNIEKHGSWYEIYDEKGKKTKTLSATIGEVEGFGRDFFVVSRSAWIELYDEGGRKYKTLPASIGNIVSVSSNGFVVRNGSWLDTYDKTGKKINTRSAK